MPRFDQSFSGLCEQNLQDTLQLKQRYLDTKNKRAPKSKEKKQQESIQSNVHVHQKFLKRPSEEHDPNAPNENFEPPVKLQCTTQHGTHQPEGLTKFSVEIVQQLEFTTSAANSQPQQISTNVTVKTHANASVKSDVSSSKSEASTPPSNGNKTSAGGGVVDIGALVESVKQEPDNDFADLDQCAAALEKDAAAGRFSVLIGDDTNDAIITSDAFKDLISDISNYPELMKDFDFDDKTETTNIINGLKVEDMKDLTPGLDNMKNTQSPLLANQNNYSPPVFEQSKSRMSYSNMDFTKTELSPAAQTLKQMAEQHQHKNQMGLQFNPNSRTSRSPFSDFQFQDYGSPNSNSSYLKNSPSFPQPDLIKQEMIFQNSDFDMKRKGSGIYKQQYSSPYGSPNASSHGSPGYLPRGGSAGASAGPSGSFSGGTPPRPPSGPGVNSSGTTLQISQAQQLHFSQQGHGHNIQVSAGQHLHLSGDIKGNVSIAAQQGMHFSQNTTTTNSNQQNPQNATHQQSPLSANQQQQHQTSMPQQNQNNQHQGSSNPMGQPQQSQPQMQTPIQQHNMHQGPMGMQGPGLSSNGMGGNVMGGPGAMHHGNQMTETYNLSQTQTINFTQQTLRQRANGPNGNGNPMGQTGPISSMGPMATPRHMAPQTMDQKLFQQQQLLRAQAMQQHIVRPPPPDYKSISGMMQGMQPRFTGTPSTIRRMPQQPMPPSGPMIRPHNMYIMQQQHMNARNMYPRQQAPMSAIDNMPQHGSSEWRHLLMTQQQNANFSNHMRPNFQHQAGFNPGGMQLSALQHQQLRTQQNVPGASVNQAQVMNQSGPMSQMSNMSQQMMHLQQQQNLLQQSPAQMPGSAMHMQQTQSLTVSNMQQQSSNLSNQQLMNNPSNSQSNAMNNFNVHSTDFSLEFLENLPTTDSGFDQELLSSFDSDSGFNLDF